MKHYSPFNFTMGIPFAHGSQKWWIVAALWQLSPFKFKDNPRQVPLAKHAGPFQWPAWLYSVFKNRSCQGLSPNPRRDWQHSKNCNYYPIWFVWISFHAFWLIQRRPNFSKNDGPNHRWPGRCVSAFWKVNILNSDCCSLSLWRVVRGSKLMHLELIHGLFIT